MADRRATGSDEPIMSKRPCQDIRQAGMSMSQEQKTDLVLRFWPTGDHERGARTSGINCLIVLLKRIYSSVMAPLWNRDDTSMKKIEADNPFMAHAWLVLNPVGKDVGAALDELIAKVWDKRLEDITMRDLQFQHLASHPRMLATIWSMDQFNPILKPLWSHQNTRKWRSLAHPDTPEAVLDSAAELNDPCPANHSISAFPGMSLDTEVNKLFGEISDDDWMLLIRPSTPQFFYVTFNVTKVGQNRLDIDTFRQLKLHVGKFVELDGSMVWQRTKLEAYTLIAIVKHRKNLDEHDTIRVYDDMGSHYLPKSTFPEYATPSWKMADMENGDSFLALYVYSKLPPNADPPFPEISRQRDLKDFEGLYDQCSQALGKSKAKRRLS